jgi:hypothetical protein
VALNNAAFTLAENMNAFVPSVNPGQGGACDDPSALPIAKLSCDETSASQKNKQI